MYTLLSEKKRIVAIEKKNGYEIGDFAFIKKLEPGRTKIGLQEYKVLSTNLYDLMLTLKRKAQIITLKDAAYMVARCGIRSGMRVIEAGAGSGALTTVLLWYVYPDGDVYTYEIREDFAKIARNNVERLENRDHWHLKMGDVRDGVDEQDVDAFILDIPDPWNAVESAKNALKYSGTFCAFVPTYNQLEKTYHALKKSGFVDLEACELIKRDIVVGDLGTRPSNIEVPHTGFMVFGRKI